jgi:hypothetical protein
LITEIIWFLHWLKLLKHFNGFYPKQYSHFKGVFSHSHALLPQVRALYEKSSGFGLMGINDNFQLFFQVRSTFSYLSIYTRMVSYNCQGHCTYDFSVHHGILILFVYVLIYLGGTGVWTQGFIHAEQVLYQASQTASPSCSGVS